jgi:hypothetical protein
MGACESLRFHYLFTCSIIPISRSQESPLKSKNKDTVFELTLCQFDASFC